MDLDTASGYPVSGIVRVPSEVPPIRTSTFRQLNIFIPTALLSSNARCAMVFFPLLFSLSSSYPTANLSVIPRHSAHRIVLTVLESSTRCPSRLPLRPLAAQLHKCVSLLSPNTCRHHLRRSRTLMARARPSSNCREFGSTVSLCDEKNWLEWTSEGSSIDF